MMAPIIMIFVVWWSPDRDDLNGGVVDPNHDGGCGKRKIIGE